MPRVSPGSAGEVVLGDVFRSCSYTEVWVILESFGTNARTQVNGRQRLVIVAVTWFNSKTQPASLLLFGLVLFCFCFRFYFQDYLKDTKACLTNDFSRYKRALTSVRQELPNADSLAQVSVEGAVPRDRTRRLGQCATRYGERKRQTTPQHPVSDADKGAIDWCATGPNAFGEAVSLVFSVARRLAFNRYCARFRGDNAANVGLDDGIFMG